MFALFVSIIIVGLFGSIASTIASGVKADRQREADARRAAEAEAAARAMKEEKARKLKAEADERREAREMEAAERRERAIQRHEKKLQREHDEQQRREARQREAQAKADAAKRREEAEAAKREAARAARIAAARELAELRERELAAARELAQLQGRGKPSSSAVTVSKVDDRPAAEAPQKPATDAAKPFEKPAAVTLEAFAEAHAAPQAVREARRNAPKPFAGQVVSFTGKLSITRREAIKKVQDAGGRAYEDMPAGTTLLVVGSKPGMKKMDKADKWIGQVRKVTEAQFLAMFAA